MRAIKLFIPAILIFLSACTASQPLPTATIQPTFTDEPPPTATEPPTPTPPATGEGGDANEETPPAPDTNMLTYKNAEGQVVTVKLATYEYTNKQGVVMEVVQPPDQMAALKLLADRSQWYPMGTEFVEVGLPIWNDKDLHDLLAQFDISWPPKDRRSWVEPFPNGGGPFMPVFMTGWEDGTLVVGQADDGSYFTVFYPGTPNEFSKFGFDTKTIENQYLQELAAEHE